MKGMSFKAKLWLLSVSLTVLAIVASGISWFGSDRLATILNKVTKDEIPALRALGMADMYHDGLRGAAYQLHYLAQAERWQDFDQAVADVNESSKKMIEEMETAGSVDISAEYRQAYDAVMPVISRYLEAVKSATDRQVLLDGAVREKVFAAIDQTFDVLERELGSLGDIFEKESLKIEADAAKIQSFSAAIVLGSIFFSAIFGLFFSYVIVNRINRQLTSIVDSLTGQ